MTITGRKVDGKVSILLRGRNERERVMWSDVRNKRYYMTMKTQTDHIQSNINSDQLTQFWTEAVEGSHSNKTRTTSKWPLMTARWMGRSPYCYEEETRKRLTWEINDTTRPTRQTDHNQLRSTYIVLNRKNSGRITLQQHTNHFRVTIHCSKVNGKLIILLRGRHEI